MAASSSCSGGLVAVSRRPPTAGSAPEQRGDNGNDVAANDSARNYDTGPWTFSISLQGTSYSKRT